MIHVVTYIEVVTRSTSEAGTLLEVYRKNSSRAPGLLGGGTLRENHRQNRFAVIETWDEEAAFLANESSAPTAELRFRLKEMELAPQDQRVHQTFSVAAPKAETSALLVVTHVDVPPPRREETEVLLRRLAEESRRDPGNTVYDIFQQNAPRANHFTLVAGWTSPEAFALHEAQPHTRLIRASLGPMLGAPYDDRLYTPAPRT
ncbi:MAG TPA: antibiotic biosynthesis monooxygenase [Terriglobia bacterium]|nr:antibiotic biosynthesis monooxygenase [Terriglobia bacterium]